MSKCRFLLLLVLGLAFPGRAQAQMPDDLPDGARPVGSQSKPAPSPAPRAVLPVRMVVLTNGARRFVVPLTIAGTQVEAALDTASVGLRVLPGVVNSGEVKSTGRASNSRYGSGATYAGVIAEAPVEVAGIKGEVTFQQIETVGCIPRLPNCPASKIPLADYGIMGDGIAGQGFKAIIGVASKEIDIGNPFRQLGVARFIADLPRNPNETGQLILNPEPADLVDFKVIPPYRRIPAQTGLTADTVNGCLVAETKKKKICGALTFDSGAPGIVVASPDDMGDAWPEGTKARMLLDGRDGKPLVTRDLVIGNREESAHLSFRQFEFMPKTVIRMGIGPYFSYSVLHSLNEGGLAVRPRKD